MYTLGIWDGHDSGITILDDDKILFAINEERITKKKLDVGFPINSIKYALDYLEMRPDDFEVVSATTSDPGKTMSRLFPAMAKRYYLFRRRKIEKPKFESLNRNIKYLMSERSPNIFSNRVTKLFYHSTLNKLGFKDYKFHLIDHHSAHAASAAFTSGMKKQVVMTVDGVGDGISSTVSVCKNGDVERIAQNAARDSLGLFYEQVTNLMGMRELEDEGKVMALSNYSKDIPDEKNKMISFFDVDGLKIKSKYNSFQRLDMLGKKDWNTEREEYSFMAQRVLEKNLSIFARNAMEETGVKNISMAGGVFSNVKANMLIRQLAKDWFVFPHMGDGGLSMGAAMQANYLETGASSYDFKHAYYGPEYSDDEVKKELQKANLKFEKISDPSGYAGEMISKDKIGFWFQDRMEYGPRALGNRSIITSSTNPNAKDALNLIIKKRNWFQPFCPSLLAEEASRLFEDVGRYDKFMTMGYKIKEEFKDVIVAIKNVDDTARPQMLCDENPKYRRLIEKVKADTGLGIILNTSLNIHGYPMVNGPDDAVFTFKTGKPDFMIMGDFLVEKK